MGKFFFCLLAGLGAALNPFFAIAEDVDLQLVLAIDVSSSVNYEEFGLQMRGYSAAFRDAEIHEAIMSGPNKQISVAMTQWAGQAEQKLVLGWAVLSSKSDALEFADRIDNLPRSFPFGGTAIDPALKHAFSQFSSSSHRGLRHIIDLSGDGVVSVGTMPDTFRDEIVAQGVTINGLPILNEIPDLAEYFKKHVAGGSGSFVQIAKDYKDFSRAIKVKLAREIKGQWFGV
ncbi:MAG: DUF1194 domain-containing protein [Sneathiella sp.]